MGSVGAAVHVCGVVGGGAGIGVIGLGCGDAVGVGDGILTTSGEGIKILPLQCGWKGVLGGKSAAKRAK